MLRHLAPNRLVARCKHAPALAPARPILGRRPVEPCSWSKRDEVLSNWEALRANPSEWYDNRTRKQNDRQPDFVRKDDRSVAIWVDSRDTPEWADELLSELDTRRQGGGRESRESREDNTAALEATAEKWQHLREQPEAWYDNRNRKTNDRQPDFVNKTDRTVAIWLNSRSNPEWAEEVLAELDARPRGYQSGGGRTSGGDPRVLANWESLRDDPDNWYDNRKRKTSDRQPDFVRKDNRQMAIWLDRSDNPPWAEEVLEALALRKAERAIERGVADERWAANFAKWKDLWENPDAWVDCRTAKTNERQPDFRRKDDRQVALWLQGGWVPDWLEGLLLKLQSCEMEQDPSVTAAELGPDAYASDPQAEAENWELMRVEPNLWYDNRDRKTKPEDPDFCLKNARHVVLWLESPRKPAWVDAFIPILDARRELREARRREQQQLQEQPQQYGYDNQQQQEYYPAGHNDPEQQPQAYQEQQVYAQDVGGQQQQSSRSSGRGAAGGADWEAKRAMEAANWESLRSEPDLWYDNRQMKANDRWPDFRRKDDKNVALWLNSRNIPEWLPDFLPVLDERQAQRAALRSAVDFSTV